MLDDLQSLPPGDICLSRCQVDVSFPPGYKTGSQLHCPWYTECHGRAQIIEVQDTGWETYHFPAISDAQRFVELTKHQVENGSFAHGRLPSGSEVRVQLRAAVEIARDVVARTDRRERIERPLLQIDAAVVDVPLEQDDPQAEDQDPLP